MHLTQALCLLCSFWLIYMLRRMRTTIDIPDDILNEAMKASSLSSKRDAVVEGLKELIKKAHREQLRSLAGKVAIDIGHGRKSRAR